MAQPTLLVLDLREKLIPDDGLKYGKEDQDRKVVEMLQAEARARYDRSGLEALQFLVSTERAIPREPIPMLLAESAEQFELVPGRNIPGPGTIEVDHSNKALKAFSNANWSNACILNPSCSMMLHRSSGSFSTLKIMNFCKRSVRSTRPYALLT
jgi:hypothetical protein